MGRLLIFTAAVLLLSACVTPLFEQAPPTAEHYFKEAQAALVRRDFERALGFHRLLFINYPDNIEILARATLANAQIHLEQGKSEQAKSLYRALVAAQQQPEGDLLPPALAILAKKNLDLLEPEGNA